MPAEDKVNILIVDDLRANLMVMQGVLAALGQNVVLADSGRAALRHVLDTDFACILLDVMMPELDGYETARLIRERERSRRTPIVFVTASDQSLEGAKAGYACGAVDFLSKPVLPEILLAKVSQFVEMARKDRQLQRQCELLATERQQLLAELERFFLLSADLMSVKSPNGQRRRVNAAYTRLTGFSEAELLSAPWLDVVHPEDRAATAAAVEHADTGDSLINRIRCADGSYRQVSWSWARDPATGYTYAAGRDLTRQLELQRQLVQAQKMQAVGQLAGGVAHDFNNLLTVILGNCELVSHSLPEGSPDRESLEQAQRAATRASELTRHLLAFSRQSVTQPRVIELNTLVTDSLKMLGRLLGAHIEQRVELVRDAPTLVKVDPGQMEQVLMNLAVNARDAMPGGGRLTIRTERATFTDGCVAHDEHPAGLDCVMLEVADTGIGMAEDTLAHIFEPFFTTKEAGRGTGLGLSTVFGIVSQHDGHLTVKSEPGRGTLFRIWLPAAAAEEASREAQVKIAPEPGKSETILLVEDQDSVRGLAIRILRRQGYSVLAASHGAQALERLAGHEGPVHLLLTDLVMPGMSGAELAQRVTALRPETRVLFMSGYSRAATEFPSQLSADVHFLQKPFSVTELARKVREVLDGD